ncbi:hypothetical protein ACH5Y9_13110 [Methylomonas sp. BW4-1]|uniref:hypothetical protein n=1 Tax=unclassified Methylomonas TaxID=2608980 RepID=UPI0039F49163
MSKLVGKLFKTTEMIVIYVSVLVAFVLVFVSYFLNFNDRVADDVQVWGAFGSYVGGTLSPIVAGFAFYLICKTYELQKKELQDTRQLLEVSTKAQKAQVKLAALTALHSLNLTRISQLEFSKQALFEKEAKFNKPFEIDLSIVMQQMKLGVYGKPKTYLQEDMDNINSEIERLKKKNIGIEIQIEAFEL